MTLQECQKNYDQWIPSDTGVLVQCNECDLYFNGSEWMSHTCEECDLNKGD